MEDSAKFGIFGLCVLFFILGFTVGIPHVGDRELINRASELVRECEYDLPRNERCEIVLDAIPVESDRGHRPGD